MEICLPAFKNSPTYGKLDLVKQQGNEKKCMHRRCFFCCDVYASVRVIWHFSFCSVLLFAIIKLFNVRSVKIYCPLLLFPI